LECQYVHKSSNYYHKRWEKYNYLKIVKSYRDKKGRSRQEIVANLGQVEKLGDELDFTGKY